MDTHSKRFRVSGVCFVPTEVTMDVCASSPEEAVKKALSSNWKDHVPSGNGEDYSAAFDWQPFAELISEA